MPVFYDFHKVKQLLAIEHLHAEVIQYEQVSLRELGKEPVQCAGDSCKGNLLEETVDIVVCLLESVLITGAAGTGKSWLGTALGHQACMNGLKVAYYNVYRLFEEIALARISSTLHRFFAKLAQTDLLILDDFGMKVLDGQQLLDFMEIIEDRHGQKATIIISQLPVADWYDVMKGNTTAADAILDRKLIKVLDELSI